MVMHESGDEETTEGAWGGRKGGKGDLVIWL